MYGSGTALDFLIWLLVIGLIIFFFGSSANFLKRGDRLLVSACFGIGGVCRDLIEKGYGVSVELLVLGCQCGDIQHVLLELGLDRRGNGVPGGLDLGKDQSIGIGLQLLVYVDCSGNFFDPWHQREHSFYSSLHVPPFLLSCCNPLLHRLNSFPQAFSVRFEDCQLFVGRCEPSRVVMKGWGMDSSTVRLFLVVSYLCF